MKDWLAELTLVYCIVRCSCPQVGRGTGTKCQLSVGISAMMMSHAKSSLVPAGGHLSGGGLGWDKSLLPSPCPLNHNPQVPQTVQALGHTLQSQSQDNLGRTMKLTSCQKIVWESSGFSLFPISIFLSMYLVRFLLVLWQPSS